MEKSEIIGILETRHGVGNVKIYANGSIFSRGILLGQLSEFSTIYAPSSATVNEHKSMDTGYGQLD